MISVGTRWTVADPPDPDKVNALVRELQIPGPLAALLVQRGYDSPEAAKRFLKPALGSLSDPYEMRDMDRAVEVIAAAVRSGETILVHGDYDVDGQCGAALLTRTLRQAGAKVVSMVPHRIRDGYDFGPAGLALAAERRAGVIVTVDCGTTARDAIARAKEQGHRVVVTDHHMPGPLPPADAVVNPHRPDCSSEAAKVLCGTGVAFKLAQALSEELGLPENFPYYLLDLVALATVADMVPLAGENRILVRYGLKMLRKSRWPGVRALIEAARLEGKEIRASHVGFILGPRLNAVGRIGDAMEGLRLLLSEDEEAARQAAQQLEDTNARRQRMDQEILGDAMSEIEREIDLDQNYALVLARDGWHPGVIGIVASRIVERTGRPTILVALDGDEGRGSGRSIPRFDLHGALLECAGYLERFGGHTMAAGLSIRREALPGFREAFNRIARRTLEAEDLIPTQRIDLMVGLDQLDLRLEQLLRRLEPCGLGNPAPVFAASGVRVIDPRPVRENHVRFVLEGGGARLPVIAFDWGDRLPEGWTGAKVDVAFRLERDEWQGLPSLKARLVDLRFAAV
ncbi:MAG: single-stranded-DNA-specific exonuclease RecJ [Gemmatimonadales bacterium]|nr:MAG: single-stranded-DNA-specific exonuclease RecJ [Gemmatimonadales bacterium]